MSDEQDRQAANKSGPGLPERALASTPILGNIAIGLAFFLAPLVVNYALPLVPISVALIPAVLLGVLSLKARGIALLAFAVLSLLHVAYQLQAPAWVSALLAVWLVLSVVLEMGSRDAALGIVAGVVAATLMHTGYYFIALPLVFGTALLPFRESVTGAVTGAVAGSITFLLVYVPFLLAGPLPPDSRPPVLLGRVQYAYQPPIQSLTPVTVQESFGFLQEAVSREDAFSTLNWGVTTDENGNRIVMRGQGDSGASSGVEMYFVNQFGGYLLPGIIFLPGLLVAMHSLVLRIPQRGIPRRLRSRTAPLSVADLAPLISFAMTGLTAFALLEILQGFLRYESGLGDGAGVAGLIVLPILLGSIGGAYRVYHRHRATRRALNAELDEDLRKAAESLQQSRRILGEITRRCPRLEVGEVERNLVEMRDRVARARNRAPGTSASTLEAMIEEVRYAHTRDAPAARSTLEHELREFVTAILDEYTGTLEQVASLDLPGVQVTTSMLPAAPTGSADDMLRAYENLEAEYRELAGKLSGTGREISEAIRTNMNPDFTSRMVEIGASLVENGEYQEASNTLIQELQRIDESVEGSLSSMSQQISGANTNLRRIVARQVVPVVGRAGNVHLMNRLNALLEEAQQAADSTSGARNLGHILVVIQEVKRLGRVVRTTLDEMWQEFIRLEEDNDSRCPEGYQWGSDPVLKEKVYQVVSEARDSDWEAMTLRQHIQVMDKIMTAIGELGEGIREYARQHEMLINSAGVNYIIHDVLQRQHAISAQEVPVAYEYAKSYLSIYQTTHSSETTLDSRSWVLRYVGNPNGDAR